MPRIRYFAQAREAAGTAAEEVGGATVGDVLAAAVVRHGARLEAVLAFSAVWLDGEACTPDDPVAIDGEVAVLPPVSGGFDREGQGRRGGGVGTLSAWPSATPSPRISSKA